MGPAQRLAVGQDRRPAAAVRVDVVAGFRRASAARQEQRLVLAPVPGPLERLHALGVGEPALRILADRGERPSPPGQAPQDRDRGGEADSQPLRFRDVHAVHLDSVSAGRCQRQAGASWGGQGGTFLAMDGARC